MAPGILSDPVILANAIVSENDRSYCDRLNLDRNIESTTDIPIKSKPKVCDKHLIFFSHFLL